MALKNYNPTSPARRGLILVDRSGLHKGGPVKALTEGKRKTGGRNNKGHVTSRGIAGGHKQRYRIIDFKRRLWDVEGNVERIEYDPNRTAFIALINYGTAETPDYAYIIAPQRLGVGGRVDQAAELEARVGEQRGDDRHVRRVDQLVGHQHPSHPVPVRIAYLRRGRQGDAPGAGLQLHREQLRAHGGLAVRGQLDPVGVHEPAHPVQVVGQGRVAQHRHRQADVAFEDAPAGRGDFPGVEHRLASAQALAGQLSARRLKQILVWHPDPARGPRLPDRNLCTT